MKRFGQVKQLERVLWETFPIYAREKSSRKNPFKPFHIQNPFTKGSSATMQQLGEEASRKRVIGDSLDSCGLGAESEVFEDLQGELDIKPITPNASALNPKTMPRPWVRAVMGMVYA